MTKKDKLGAGRFGSTQTTSVSARRQAVAQATGVPTTGAPDSRLRTLPLEQLVPTAFNPRRNFGSETDLKEFGQKLKTKQLQPAVAVTREAYLKLWEDEADAVGTHRYVIANGERRYRASQLIGLETLEVIVDDTIATSRATFLDAVLSENNDREDLDPVEQAIGIQTMVDQLGGKTKVAEHYGKSAGWVTQQLYLLKLAPELQQLVSSGILPVRETRALIKLPVEEQATAWENRLTAREVEKEDKQEKRRSGPSVSAGFTAVKPEPSGVAEIGEAAVEPPADFTAVKPAASVTDQASPEATAGTATQGVVSQDSETRERHESPADPSEGVPEPRQSHSDTNTGVRKFPYDNGKEAAFFLNQRMDDDQFLAMVDEVTRMANLRREKAAEPS
ncbi:ParB/RepB/Spo0J family partition protein [Streptomyces kunmingensis]|uniref:ParB/RepB/Spo0J family partition protein n=1 Tax=Streptomyces kunmingensis TaxID=68225 RepID=A0ABU6CD22_9ACTN|nr:ParB/RepB/Spo0J family partition protein [Streptomyces kunmingensis]MEB3962620.1 ParB/RepB/Spo0J family partition protein [Streptomyces kunmingensis]